MDTIADSIESSRHGLISISKDDAIAAFLKSSADDLPKDLRRRLDEIAQNETYEERLACRAICRSIGKLAYFQARDWYRAALDVRQIRCIRLGQESSNNFSRFFSSGTHDPGRAAESIRTWSGLNDEQRMHQEKVMRYADSIEISNLADVILCASNYIVNRKLKIFDGNHRIIAYILRHEKLPSFSCIVGFSRPRYIGLLQRALLGFEFVDETRGAVAFALQQNLTRARSLLKGGTNYQPLLENGTAMRRLASSTGDAPPDSGYENQRAERVCTDRARVLRDDMRCFMDGFEGRTLLDIGCNVGFFCHYFAALGMRAIGIDNSQHNRHQRFSMSNSVRIAREMNDRYGLSCEFFDADARDWVARKSGKFDVVLLLSVLHHFFLGYPLGDAGGDPMHAAKSFLVDVARITGEVLYIEYEDRHSTVSRATLEQLLASSGWFKSVELIEYSRDFGRPMIRCRKR